MDTTWQDLKNAAEAVKENIGQKITAGTGFFGDKKSAENSQIVINDYAKYVESEKDHPKKIKNFDDWTKTIRTQETLKVDIRDDVDRAKAVETAKKFMANDATFKTVEQKFLEDAKKMVAQTEQTAGKVAGDVKDGAGKVVDDIKGAGKQAVKDLDGGKDDGWFSKNLPWIAGLLALPIIGKFIGGLLGIGGEEGLGLLPMLALAVVGAVGGNALFGGKDNIVSQGVDWVKGIFGMGQAQAVGANQPAQSASVDTSQNMPATGSSLTQTLGAYNAPSQLAMDNAASAVRSTKDLISISNSDLPNVLPTRPKNEQAQGSQKKPSGSGIIIN